MDIFFYREHHQGLIYLLIFSSSAHFPLSTFPLSFPLLCFPSTSQPSFVILSQSFHRLCLESRSLYRAYLSPRKLPIYLTLSLCRPQSIGKAYNFMIFLRCFFLNCVFLFWFFFVCVFYFMFGLLCFGVFFLFLFVLFCLYVFMFMLLRFFCCVCDK